VIHERPPGTSLYRHELKFEPATPPPVPPAAPTP
jgi:hypothetical protein